MHATTLTPPPATIQPATPRHPLLELPPYEKAVYQRQSNEVAVGLLIKLIDGLEALRGGEGLLSRTSRPSVVRSAYTRVAAAISAHVRAPDFRLSAVQYHKLCAKKWVLEAIFGISGFEDPHHLLEDQSHTDAQGKLHVKPFVALFYSLDDIPEFLFETVVALPGKHLLPLLLGWIGGSRVQTARGEVRVKRLVEVGQGFAKEELAPELLLPLAHAWMLCSYFSFQNKHDIKRTLNDLWRIVDDGEGVRARSVPRRLVQKPRLLVAAERMSIGHAMHRSYESCLVQLRKHFTVALLVRASDYDERTAYLFDEVEAFESLSTLAEIAGKLVRQQPDVIYYPSLGMSDWTQAMANLRMAPVQFMTLGHPASSMSDTVDYVLLQRCHEEAANTFSEKVLVRRGSGTHSPNSKLTTMPTRTRPADNIVHVAANSNLMKLSARFLAVCVRLQQEAGRPLHFHFFTSAVGVRLDDLRNRLTALLQNVTVYESADYPIFMQNVANCDMAMAAFPFGNTNSAVDTALLGIPSVAYRAAEVLSMGDQDIMKGVGLPDWLLTSSDEEYFQAALRLVQDDKVRTEISDYLKQCDVAGRLFSLPPDEEPNEFVDAVWWMYQEHEKLQASQQRIFKVGETIPA